MADCAKFPLPATSIDLAEDECGFGGRVGGDVFGDRRATGINQLERKFAEVAERAGVDAAYQSDRVDLIGYSSEVDEEALVRTGFGFAAAEIANRAVSRFLLVVEDEVRVGPDFSVGTQKQCRGIDTEFRIVPGDHDVDLIEFVGELDVLAFGQKLVFHEFPLIAVHSRISHLDCPGADRILCGFESAGQLFSRRLNLARG